MKRNWKRPTLALVVALWAFYVLNAFLPTFRLSAFIPLICVLFYEKNKNFSLWASFSIGCLLDLFSSNSTFALLPLCYCLTTWFLYQYKPFFFEDSWTTLPILSYLFSAISTLIYFVLLTIYGLGFTFSWTWFFIDILFMSCFDGLYAFLAFTLPLRFLPHRLSHGDSFILKRRPH